MIRDSQYQGAVIQGPTGLGKLRPKRGTGRRVQDFHFHPGNLPAARQGTGKQDSGAPGREDVHEFGKSSIPGIIAVVPELPWMKCLCQEDEAFHVVRLRMTQDEVVHMGNFLLPEKRRNYISPHVETGTGKSSSVYDHSP